MRTIGWLHSTTAGISYEEEPVEWTSEYYEDICDTITLQEVESRGVASRTVGRAGVHGVTRILGKKFQPNSVIGR